MPELRQAQIDALTAIEYGVWEGIQADAELGNIEVGVALEVCRIAVSLADARIKSEARRKMLKKHEHCIHGHCPECDGVDEHPDCALDALAKEE